MLLQLCPKVELLSRVIGGRSLFFLSFGSLVEIIYYFTIVTELKRKIERGNRDEKKRETREFEEEKTVFEIGVRLGPDF